MLPDLTTLKTALSKQKAFFSDAYGQPRQELFAADKLHFNSAGYKLLAEESATLFAER